MAEIQSPNYAEAAGRNASRPQRPTRREEQQTVAGRIAGHGDAAEHAAHAAAVRRRVERHARLRRAQEFAARLVGDEAKQVAEVMGTRGIAPSQVGWHRLWHARESTNPQGVTTAIGLSRRGKLFHYVVSKTVTVPGQRYKDEYVDGSGIPREPLSHTETVAVSPSPVRMTAGDILPPDAQDPARTVISWRSAFMHLVTDGAESYAPVSGGQQELENAFNAILQPPPEQ